MVGWPAVFLPLSPIESPTKTWQGSRKCHQSWSNSSKWSACMRNWSQAVTTPLGLPQNSRTLPEESTTLLVKDSLWTSSQRTKLLFQAGQLCREIKLDLPKVLLRRFHREEIILLSLPQTMPTTTKEWSYRRDPGTLYSKRQSEWDEWSWIRNSLNKNLPTWFTQLHRTWRQIASSTRPLAIIRHRQQDRGSMEQALTSTTAVLTSREGNEFAILMGATKVLAR